MLIFPLNAESQPRVEQLREYQPVDNLRSLITGTNLSRQTCTNSSHMQTGAAGVEMHQTAASNRNLDGSFPFLIPILPSADALQSKVE